MTWKRMTSSRLTSIVLHTVNELLPIKLEDIMVRREFNPTGNNEQGNTVHTGTLTAKKVILCP